MAGAHDPATLAFYDREAQAYAARTEAQGGPPPHLWAFLDRLTPGGRILELGCGAGRDAAAMIARGFDVDATDGSPALALQAQARLGRPARVMLFEALDAAGAYDAVWANAALLHVPEAAVAEVLGRVNGALRPGGLFCATYKAGAGRGGRDGLGRYFNYPSRERLRAAYDHAGPWAELEIESGEGGGYDGQPTHWLLVMAKKG
jgi:SAM-dependent methyltransferase